MRRRVRHGLAVALAIAFCLLGIRTALAAHPRQPERLRDIDALIQIVHRLAPRIHPQNIDVESIDIVKSFAIVEWFAQPTRQSIAHNSQNEGGTFLARKSVHEWILVRQLPLSYTAATLTRTAPGLSPAIARALIHGYRIGASLQGCNRDGKCRSTSQEIAFAVEHESMAQDRFMFAPVVAPIARDGNFALADYTVGESGGEAMLQRKNDRWKVLGMGGGSMNSIRWLSSGFRLSLAVARTLVTSMKKNEAATFSDLCVPKRQCLNRARSATSAFLTRFAKAGGAPPNAAVREVAIAGTNALLYYNNGETGGEALLQLRNNRWEIRAMGPVSLADSDLLVKSLGMSPTDAARLAYRMTDLVR